MEFNFQSYRDKALRPTPHVHIEEEGEVIIIATPWGQTEGAKKLTQSLLEFYYSIQEDTEMTSPFEHLDCMSAKANHLRTAIRLANDTLRKEYNREKFITACELFIGIKEKNNLYWAQIGQPNLFLIRNKQHIYPMGQSLDLSFDFERENQKLPSLPSQLVGIYNTTQFSIQHLKTQVDDQILFISGGKTPHELYQLSEPELQLNTLTNLICEKNPKLPFWVGLLKV